MPLKRQLGLLRVIILGVGIILGAGIYALVGKAAGVSGYGVWLGFLLASIVALFTGLSYAELAAMIPRAGAEFHYSKKAYGRKVGFITGWILILAGVISTATVAWGFGNYFNSLFGLPSILAAIALIIASVLVIMLGVKEATNIGGFLSIIEALGLVIIIVICFPFFFSNNIAAKIFDFSSFSLFSIIQTAALVFFAYIGFEEIARLAEETKEAEKNIPKALIIAIIITTVIYILVSISAVSVLTPTELSASNAPLGDVAGRIFGSGAFFWFSIIALIATGSTVLLILLATSRIVYGISEDNELPHIIARIDKHSGTPVLAVILSGFLAICFLFLGDIELVANATDLLLFIAFSLINLSVVRLRFSDPGKVRPFRIPFNIGRVPIPAVLGFITCSLLMFGVRKEVFIVGIGLIVLGLLFEHFYALRHFREKHKL